LSKSSLPEGAKELREKWDGFRAARVFLTAHKGSISRNLIAIRIGPIGLIDGT
jgi:hypothetical protein